MAIFYEIIGMVSLKDPNYEGLSEQVNSLIKSSPDFEIYRQKGNFVYDRENGLWRVEVEHSMMNSTHRLGPNTENNSCGSEISLDERLKLESAVATEILSKEGITAVKEYLGYSEKPKEEVLDSLKNYGLPKTAKRYGIPTETLLTLNNIKLFELQDAFGFARKRPRPQKALEEALNVEHGFLYGLKERGLL